MAYGRLTVSVFLTVRRLPAASRRVRVSVALGLCPRLSTHRPAAVSLKRMLMAPVLAFALPLAMVLLRARSVAVALALSEARKLASGR